VCHYRAWQCHAPRLKLPSPGIASQLVHSRSRPMFRVTLGFAGGLHVPISAPCRSDDGWRLVDGGETDSFSQCFLSAGLFASHRARCNAHSRVGVMRGAPARFSWGTRQSTNTADTPWVVGAAAQ